MKSIFEYAIDWWVQSLQNCTELCGRSWKLVWLNSSADGRVKNTGLAQWNPEDFDDLKSML